MIKNYLSEIDLHYAEAKKKRLSRLSVEWGKWSTEMNRGIRSLIKNNHPQKTSLIYVQNYWQIKSQLLELHYRGKLHGLAGKKRLAREAKRIKRLLIFDKIPDCEHFFSLQ